MAVSISRGSPGFPRSGSINTYDLAGNRTLAELGTGHSIAQTFDRLNRVETVTEGGRTVRYVYDVAGRAVRQHNPNGQHSRSSYDAQGRLVSRTLYSSPTTAVPEAVLASFAWRHDEAGHVTRQEGDWPGVPERRVAGAAATGPVTAMTYDAWGRLDTETVTVPGQPVKVTDHDYDDADNRTLRTIEEDGVLVAQSVFGYNARNQLDSLTKADGLSGHPAGGSVTAYGYDDNGNQVSQSVVVAGGAAEVTDYDWDRDNRLVAVETPDQGDFGYAYDYRTRRISTHEQPSAPGSTPSAAKHTTISFSGGLSAAEWEADGRKGSGVDS